METIKSILRLFWNFLVFCAMCIGMMFTVVYWVFIVVPSRIYRYLREA